ncbi:MAG: hypothetical protein ACRDZ8_15860 [Acidimicrobiales bacterium]
MPLLRHKLIVLVSAITLMCAASSLGAIAVAQSYPPGSSVPSCTPGNVNIGPPVPVGQSVTLNLCGGFTAGTSVTIKVNGVLTSVTKMPVNGAVTVVITVVSNTTLSIDDPVDVPAICGTNTVVATGQGTPGTSTGTFTLNCSTTTTSTGALALTGADVAGIIVVALVLLVVGSLLVVVQRRRRRAV